MKTKLQLISSLLWLLACSILLTIYGIWLIYPLEVDWLQLVDVVYLSKKTILYNFNHLMTYLTNPFHQTLSMPDFRSSSAGLSHFSDVKSLFHLVQALVLLLVLPALLFFKHRRNEQDLWQYQKIFFIMLCLPLVFALLGVVVGFDQFFTLFHLLLFPNDDTWLFQPSQDPVIWILPQALFLHAFLLFFCIYEGVFLILYLKSKSFEKRTKN
ncbi:TIGR01906 family membrane protein [Streptococcus sp.]|nr:TIGR01906 family membrane protein [Streptococcus sp.]MDY3823347.1 TIGR01906 family membrane protein [Streptococcus sp.]